MPFNYQTLKQITENAIVNSTLTGSDLTISAVTDTKLANSTITSAELATGSVNLTAATVTGTMPVSKGGTSTTSLGSAYNVLRTNSSNNALEYSDSGIRRMVVFTGSGTYTKTAGVRFVLVQVQGPGGGASGHGESGAAGGYAERVVDISSVSTVGVTVNGGGGGTWYNNQGGNSGGSCSFGPYVSASGGHGANRHNNHNGGLAGVGSGGDLNIYGGCGGGHEQRSSGMGGSSFFGGPAPAGHPQGGNFAHNHQGHASPGTGGTSGYFSGHRGSDGRPGIVIITEFF
jgi:hypothetical protein